MEPLRTADEQELRAILDAWTPVEWPASPNVVPQLMQQLGWKQLGPESAETDLPVSYRIAQFLIDTDFSKVPGGEFVQAHCDVSDSVAKSAADETEGKRAIRVAFETLRGTMRKLLGPENGEHKGRGKFAWWDLPTGGRVKLEQQIMSVALYLDSKRYADSSRAEAMWVSKGYPIDYEEDGTPIFGD